MTRQNLLLSVIIGFLAISCVKNNRISLNPRLPFAKNFSNKPSCDSNLFTIELKDRQILIRDHQSCSLVKDFDSIETFLCKEMRGGNIKQSYDHTISLFIDSITPFPVIDRLIEELELIGFHGAFFRTSNKGFLLIFPYKENAIQEYVVKLYGEKFSTRKRIIYDCEDTTKSNLSEAPPPPPPPPYRISLSTYDHLRKVDSIHESDDCIIKLIGGGLYINNQIYTVDSFINNIYYKKSLYVMLNKSNNYSDLIKIVDLINTVQLKKYNDYSILKFRKKYIDLSNDESWQIKREFGIRYLILSLAEQNYIEKK